MRLYLTVSGSGKVVKVADVASLEEATEIVVALDKAYARLDKAGHAALTPGSVLDCWGGCDLYVRDAHGVEWADVGDEITWEPV